MSQEAVTALQAAFDQFSRGDFAFNADLPDDFELVTAAQMPDAGTYRGREARDWLNGWIASFERLTLTPIEFIDAGDKVVVEFLQRGYPRGSTTAVELRTWSVNTMRDEVGTMPAAEAMTRLELFMTRSEALQAAGLSE
jgi:ketosteroid isomerase-like protein